MIALAFRPFLDPLNLHGVWFTLIVPLAFFISVAWKAVRIGDAPTPPESPDPDRPRFPFRRYTIEVASMTTQIVLAMAALGALSYLIVEYAAPALVP